MGANFQDVLRDVHDPSLHALKTTASLSASTIYVGTPTLYAVVNTGAAVDSTVKIGFATVAVSTPTLYAVVNTGAAGQASIVLDNSIANIGFATVAVSTPTLFAVVNTGAAGVGNSIVTVANPNFGVIGNVTLSDSKTYIGLTTATLGSMPSVLASGQYFPTPQSVVSGALSPLAVDATGGQILANSNKYIGLTSVSGTVGLGTGTLNIGSVSVLGGTINANLQTGTLNIGSVSVLGGTINSTLQTSTLNVGSVSVLGGVINANLNAGVAGIGFTTTYNGTAWPDPKTYIGLVTVGHTVTVAAHALTAGAAFIGLATTVNGAGTQFIGLTTSVNGVGTSFIGLVTAWARNAGTTKTLVPLPVGLGNNSLATVAVPTNSNKINLTQLILNSNVTTEIAIKSGVTYLTGNASLGITLFPGGGFVMNGAPDSPAWIGLPSGAMVVEKRDGAGTVSKIGGSVIYFDE